MRIVRLLFCQWTSIIRASNECGKTDSEERERRREGGKVDFQGDLLAFNNWKERDGVQ